MAIETKTTIQLGDFVAVAYECASCKSRTVRTLAEHRVPHGCGNCGERWMPDESTEADNLTRFIDALRLYASPKRNKKFAMHFEIAREKDKAEAAAGPRPA